MYPYALKAFAATRDGRLRDESKRVGDFAFGEMTFLSVGLLDDVDIEDRDWRSGGP